MSCITLALKEETPQCPVTAGISTFKNVSNKLWMPMALFPLQGHFQTDWDYQWFLLGMIWQNTKSCTFLSSPKPKTFYDLRIFRASLGCIAWWFIFQISHIKRIGYVNIIFFYYVDLWQYYKYANFSLRKDCIDI